MNVSKVEREEGSAMYGVGIVGLGRVARGHASAVQQAPEMRLAAVCDLDASRVESFVAKFGCAGESSLDDLLVRDDVDIVLIALPHGLHEQATVAAARAGKHIMVEKPMAMEVAACDRMIAAPASPITTARGRRAPRPMPAL